MQEFFVVLAAFSCSRSSFVGEEKRMVDFRRPELHKAALAEFIGTFFLTLAALVSGSPFAVGLTLAAFVYAIGDISSATSIPQ